MSWDEKVFHFAWHVLNKFKKKKYFESQKVIPYSTEAVATQIQFFASAINQSPVRIEYSDLCFGWTPHGIVVPRQIIIVNEQSVIRDFINVQVILSLIGHQHFKKLNYDHSQPFYEHLKYGCSVFNDLRNEARERFPGIEEKINSWKEYFLERHKLGLSFLITEHSLHSLILKTWGLIEDVSSDQQSFIDKKPEVTGLFTLIPMPLNPSVINGLLSDPSESERMLATGEEVHSGTLRAPQQVKLVELNSKKDESNPIHHNFEKLLTADDYQGGLKQVDGEDELNEHQEALNELNLQQVVRSSEHTRGIFKSNMMINFDFADVAEAVINRGMFQYDEWNYKTKSYRKNWCQLNEYSIDLQKREGLLNGTEKNRVFNPSVTRYQTNRLKRKLQFLLNQRRPLMAQKDGDEIDLDGTIDHLINLKSHQSDDMRCYGRRAKLLQSFSVIILQDLSYSMDSWVNNCRILDVCTESLSIIGEALENYESSVGIYGFSGNTRRDCRMIRVKGFSESWEHGKCAIQSLRPSGYTRIGPAIRHASQLLRPVSSLKKLVLILTDGRPNDYDQYEGNYGLQDVKKAVEECRVEGTVIKCLSLDKKSAAFMSQMFGHSHFYTVHNTANLPEQLFAIFKSVLSP